uniref:Uncharacterized protein n=1 Tax=Strongyloides venezuelensis TaxID=75913 RepID=A0A0K0F3S9_STRVS
MDILHKNDIVKRNVVTRMEISNVREKASENDGEKIYFLTLSPVGDNLIFSDSSIGLVNQNFLVQLQHVTTYYLPIVSIMSNNIANVFNISAISN